jgi:rare lipoprotein A
MKRRTRNLIRRRRLAALALAPALLVATTTTLTIAAAQAPGAATLETSRGSVPHGDRVTLRGGGAGAGPVAIQFQRAGGERWSAVRTVDPDAAGAFKTRVKPRYSGAYRAVPTAAAPSEPAPVRVRSAVRLDSERYAVVGRKLRLSGRAQPAAERAVTLRVGGETLRTRANEKGRFSARWRADRTGRFRPTAKVAGNALAASGSDRGRKVTVYRPASASWYGPGLYGNKMACGGTLSPGTLGVAHKSLPCGAKVHLRNGGRTVTAPVVDRGPYVGDREFDLTARTKEKLGFGSTGTVLSSK